MLHQVVIGRVRSARHHNQFHQGKSRFDLRLSRHQHHFKPALEGELHHQILGRPGAGVGVDPYTHQVFLF
ncbi:hypothetical protein D3C76_1793380 [compost metagenome]